MRTISFGLCTTAFVLSGCVKPTAQHDWTDQIAVSLAKHTSQSDSVPVGPTDETHNRSDCPTGGWITHGDGHRTRCPDCRPAYGSEPTEAPIENTSYVSPRQLDLGRQVGEMQVIDASQMPADVVEVGIKRYECDGNRCRLVDRPQAPPAAPAKASPPVQQATTTGGSAGYSSRSGGSHGSYSSRSYSNTYRQSRGWGLFRRRR